MKRQRVVKKCAMDLCGQTPSEGKWCFYHGRVMSGLIEPIVAKAYDRKLLDGAERKETARLRAEIAWATA